MTDLIIGVLLTLLGVAVYGLTKRQQINKQIDKLDSEYKDAREKGKKNIDKLRADIEQYRKLRSARRKDSK